MREFGYKVLGNVFGSVIGSLDEEIVRNFFDFFIGVLDDDVLGFDVFDYGLSEDINFVFFEGGFSVFDELFGEGGENVGEGFDKGDFELVGNFGVLFFKVILDILC